MMRYSVVPGKKRDSHPNHQGMPPALLRLPFRFLIALLAIIGTSSLAERALAAPAPAIAPVALLHAAVQDAELPPAQAPETAATEGGFMTTVDGAMGSVNAVISAVFFFDVVFWDDGVTIPLVVGWLALAAIFLTFRMGLINFRAFGHAIQVTRGKFTDPNSPGEVSHFQALSTALSATVGLGNIAGVAIAVSVGCCRPARHDNKDDRVHTCTAVP